MNLQYINKVAQPFLDSLGGDEEIYECSEEYRKDKSVVWKGR